MWNLYASNKLLAKKYKEEDHQKHLTNLATVKSTINNSAPFVPPFLKHRYKKQVMKQEENTKIASANSILQSRIQSIKKKKGNLSVQELQKTYRPALVNFNPGTRLEEHRKVVQENRDILKRLSSANPYYRTKKILDDNNKLDQIRNNISQNARRMVSPSLENFDPRKSQSYKRYGLNPLEDYTMHQTRNEPEELGERRPNTAGKF